MPGPVVTPTAAPTRLTARFHTTARICAATVVALGVVVLFGWVFDVELLKRVLPRLSSMKANTALLFVLLGVALRLARDPPRRTLRVGLAGVVTTVAALTLVEQAWAIDLGIDELLVRDLEPSAAPGRMATATAVNFTLLGLAVLGFDVPAMRRLRQGAVLIASSIAFVAACGYLFGVHALYSVNMFSSVAIHTAVGFLLAATAYVLSPGQPLAEVLASDGVAGRMLRRLMPATLILPVLAGRLLLEWRVGPHGVEFGIAVVVLAVVLSLESVTWIVAHRLYRSEVAERQAFGALAEREHELGETLQAVRASDARNRAVLNAALDAVVTIDAQGRIIEFNPAAERMFGYRRNDVLGMPLVDCIVPQSLREQFLAGFARYRRTGQSSILDKVVERTARRADGTELAVELAVFQVPGQDPPLFTGYIRDITDRQREVERFRVVLEAAPTGMLLVDESGRVMLVNSQIERMFSYDRSTLLGQPMEILVPHEHQKRHPNHRARYSAAPSVRPMGAGRELFGLRSDGTQIPIEIGLTPIDTSQGRVVLASIVDITERRHAEREARYHALFDESPVALWEKDYSVALAFLREIGSVERIVDRTRVQPELVRRAAAKVRIVDVNRRGLELFGAVATSELAARWSETFEPDDYEPVRAELLALLDGQSHFETEGLRRTLAGRPLHVRVQVTTIAGAARVIVSMVDITASKEAERALREAMGRQDVLLREIHHRVKNNLAVMASLFYLESTHTTDVRAVALLEDSRRRIRSMALVHETLYRSDNLASIDMAEYAQTLARELMATYRLPTGRVRLSTQLEPVRLSVDLAVPCGLILNELVSNAFKHAFPGDRPGSVRIALCESGDDSISMRVTDDGVGLPADLDLRTHHSLGFRLVRLLAKQLRATLEVQHGNPGTEIRVTFARSHDGR